MVIFFLFFLVLLSESCMVFYCGTGSGSTGSSTGWFALWLQGWFYHRFRDLHRDMSFTLPEKTFKCEMPIKRFFFFFKIEHRWDGTVSHLEWKSTWYSIFPLQSINPKRINPQWGFSALCHICWNVWGLICLQLPRRWRPQIFGLQRR